MRRVADNLNRDDKYIDVVVGTEVVCQKYETAAKIVGKEFMPKVGHYEYELMWEDGTNAFEFGDVLSLAEDKKFLNEAAISKEDAVAIKKMKDFYKLTKLVIKPFKELKDQDRNKVLASFSDSNTEILNVSAFAYHITFVGKDKTEHQFFIDFEEPLSDAAMFITSSFDSLFDMFAEEEYDKFCKIPNDITVKNKMIYTSDDFTGTTFVGSYNDLYTYIISTLEADKYKMLSSFVKEFDLGKTENGYVNQTALDGVIKKDTMSYFDDMWGKDGVEFMKGNFNTDYNELLALSDKVNLNKYKDLYLAKYLARPKNPVFYEIMMEGDLEGEVYKDIIEYKHWINENLYVACEFILGSEPIKNLNGKIYTVPYMGA